MKSAGLSLIPLSRQGRACAAITLANLIAAIVIDTHQQVVAIILHDTHIISLSISFSFNRLNTYSVSLFRMKSA